MRTTKSEVPAGKVDMVFQEGKGFLEKAQANLDIALQPIIDAQSGAPVGYEALMRGYEELGCASVVALLDKAYRHRVLERLDLILREKAIAKFSGLPETAGLILFYNFDVRSLERPDTLRERTLALLESHGLAGSSLCVEFAETFEYATAAHISGMIESYREDGVKFAIDDFGKGFSELMVLYQYEPDFIKIDGFFIRNIHKDSRKRLFVSTIVNLAHVLGVAVIAEGVESEDEYAVCRDIGCNFIQGYFVSWPMQDVTLAPAYYPQVSLSRYCRRKGDLSKRTFVRDRLEELPVLRDDAELAEIIEAFRHSGSRTFFPVVGRDGKPKGIIHESALKELLYAPSQQKGADARGSEKAVPEFLRKCPIADVYNDGDKILDIFTYNQIEEGIIITEDSKYIGFLSTLSLLEIMNEIRLAKARDQNPLSQLPGNASIMKYVAKLADESETNRFLCYFDFDHFKPFNDCYGFREGDRAIILFAELLRANFQESGFMLGHIGGDDFFAGYEGGELEDFVARFRLIQESFARDVESFYKAEHRKQGYIEMEDRYGKTRRFPLLSCSGAILGIPSGIEIGNPDALIRRVAELKAEAKRAGDGLAVMCYLGDAEQPKTQLDDIQVEFGRDVA